MLEVIGLAGSLAVGGLLILRYRPVPLAHLAIYAFGVSVVLQRVVSWDRGGAQRIPEWLLLGLAAGLALAVLSRRAESDRLRSPTTPPLLVALAFYAMAVIPGALVASDTAGALTFSVRLAVGVLVIWTAHIALSVDERTDLLSGWLRWLILAFAVGVITNLSFGVAADSFLFQSNLPKLIATAIGWIGFALASIMLLHSPERPLTRRQIAWLVVGAALPIIGRHHAGVVALIATGLLAAIPARAATPAPVAASGAQWRRRVGVGLAAVGTATLIIPSPLSPLFGGPNSTGVRRQMWSVGIDHLSDSPFFGRGMNSVVNAELFAEMDIDWPAPEMRQIHNTWLDVALGAGAFGLLALLAVTALLAAGAIRAFRQGRTLPVALLIGALIGSIFGPSLDRPEWLWFVVMVTAVSETARAQASRISTSVTSK